MTTIRGERPTDPLSEPPARTGDQTVRVVSARVGLWQRLRDIWRYRDLLIALTRKELKVKYKNSVLGFLWSLLNPAVTLLVFFVVFQLILKNGIPYFAIYLVSGILVWNLFSVALPQSTGSVVSNSPIVKKVAFPREILTIAPVGAALVHFFLQCIVVVIFLVAFRREPAVSYLPLLIPALIALLVVTAALGVLLAAINVKLRDTAHLIDIALMVWFWATPIIYQYRLVRDNVAHASHGAKHILFILWRFNPITPIVLTFQRAIYGQTSPRGRSGKVVAILPDHAGQWWYLWQLLLVMAFGIVLFGLALKVFGRLEGNFAEDL